MLRAMLSRVYAQMQVFSMRRHVSEVFFLQISSSNGSKPIFYTTISRYSTIFACQLSLALIVRSLMYSCHLCSEQSTHSFAPALYSCPSPLAPAFCSHTALSPAYHYTNTSEYQEKVASRPFMSPPPPRESMRYVRDCIMVLSLTVCSQRSYGIQSSPNITFTYQLISQLIPIIDLLHGPHQSKCCHPTPLRPGSISVTCHGLVDSRCETTSRYTEIW